jgi:hypothetical protein
MVRRLCFFAVLVLAWVSHDPTVFAQADRSRIMGTVIDTSGGALPGVTVTLTGVAVAPTPVVTDNSGRYLTPWVPPGTYNVTFELSGFENRSSPGVIVRAGETVVLDAQLALAQFSETVEVKAPAPPPPAPPRPPPPPRPKMKPTPELLASVCGPRQAPDFSLARAHVMSLRDDPGRQLLGPGDVLRLDAGEQQGLKSGENFVIRRRLQTGDPFASKKDQTFADQTVGLVQIMEVQATNSSAIVVYACAEILAGDSIEPYVAQPASFSVADGKPRFDAPAKIAFGDSGRTAGGNGQMMVIDQGLMQGVQRGQRLTIFRRGPAGPEMPETIGDGVIVAVRPDSATILIDRATDAVMIGDLVALHR